MKHPSKFVIGYKVLRQLGVTQTWFYAQYQLGLRTGHYRRTLGAALNNLASFAHSPYLNLHTILSLPDRQNLFDLLGDHIAELYQQADEIVQGKVRLFGGQPVSLVLNLDMPLKYWTHYELGDQRFTDQDIKFIWEPARFGWACILARAYYLSRNEQYAQTFWNYTEEFLNSNPPYYGPHWSSAQEVAIRLIALSYAFQVFVTSPATTRERSENFARVIAYHAERIPPTMVYARWQNNNHLITEALGLYTASALLPEHPWASTWHKLGWKWLLEAFRKQIEPDGTYIQHSTNYHRLMLQAALWFYSINNRCFKKDRIPPDVLERLAASVRWLWRIVDPETGYAPNLGHNDGSNILPLSVCPQQDYRPVIYSAAQSYLNLQLVPQGHWSEMASWLSPSAYLTSSQVGFDHLRDDLPHKRSSALPPYIIQNHKNSSWCNFRVAIFHARPAHADQLHVDLWWHGLNIAQDPGTYLYNAPSPWQNSLSSAIVHNTVVVDGQDFMLRAGRFMYLDWAQAEFVPGQPSTESDVNGLTATHSGYKNIGVTHFRTVEVNAEGQWEITDNLTGPPQKIRTIYLHWLLPDWEYELSDLSIQSGPYLKRLRVRSPYGWVTVDVGVVIPSASTGPLMNESIKLIRAGELIYGTGEVNPIQGWSSPTYGEKIPALAFILEVSTSLPVKVKSVWTLPREA